MTITDEDVRIIIDAAEHIERILPRPGPYAPEFYELIKLADKLKVVAK